MEKVILLSYTHRKRWKSSLFYTNFLFTFRERKYSYEELFSCFKSLWDYPIKADGYSQSVSKFVRSSAHNTKTVPSHLSSLSQARCTSASKTPLLGATQSDGIMYLLAVPKLNDILCLSASHSSPSHHNNKLYTVTSVPSKLLQPRSPKTLILKSHNLVIFSTNNIWCMHTRLSTTFWAYMSSEDS